MQVTETDRLALREFELSDAEFIYQLVNDPDWIRNIGDRNVHSGADAENYIRKLSQNYKDGLGFYGVVEKRSGELVGMCGVIKRAELEHVDLGFAFLPKARGKGFAYEASLSMIRYAKAKGFKRLLGIIDPKNSVSGRLLEKLGMKVEGTGRLHQDALELTIYGMNL